MVAQTIINSTSKVGRNDACPCGSKKKYKYCCGSGEGVIPKPKKILSPKGFQQCFMILVERAGGSVEVSCEDLEKLVEDKGKALAVKYNSNTDSFGFEMLKVKISPIAQPGNRIQIVDESKEKENQDEEDSNDPDMPVSD